MGQSCILLLEQKWRNSPKPIPPLACMRHPAQNSQSWPRLFIIDLMASTWKRDNQALFPVKQSCCFSSPHRKTQQQHASCFSYAVTFGFLGAENKTSPCDEIIGVPCLRSFYFECAFCICANKGCNALL